MTTSSSDTTATIVINRLATGPTPPQANGVWPNVLHTRITEVMKQMGTPPWSKRIIADERNLVTLIATPPGGGNRPHWHKEFDEWWVVLGGRLQWELTGGDCRERGQGRHRVGAARHGASHPEPG